MFFFWGFSGLGAIVSGGLLYAMVRWGKSDKIFYKHRHQCNACYKEDYDAYLVFLCDFVKTHGRRPTLLRRPEMSTWECADRTCDESREKPCGLHSVR